MRSDKATLAFRTTPGGRSQLSPALLPILPQGWRWSRDPRSTPDPQHLPRVPTNGGRRVPGRGGGGGSGRPVSARGRARPLPCSPPGEPGKPVRPVWRRLPGSRSGRGAGGAREALSERGPAGTEHHLLAAGLFWRVSGSADPNTGESASPSLPPVPVELSSESPGWKFKESAGVCWEVRWSLI